MIIKIEEDHLRHCWWVHMGAWAASFNALNEAEQFVSRLNERIDAPHQLPADARWLDWWGSASKRPTSNTNVAHDTSSQTRV